MPSELIGYPSRLSVRRGEDVDFMVSTDAAEFEVGLVRLRHGDENPAGPGFREVEIAGVLDKTCPGRTQAAVAGSFAVVESAQTLDALTSFTVQAWVFPTTPQRSHIQGLIAVDGGFALAADPDGRLIFSVQTGRTRTEELAGERALDARVWQFVAASYDAETGEAVLVQRAVDHRASDLAEQVSRATFAPLEGPLARSRLTMAALHAVESDGDPRPRPQGLYNGKLDGPCLFGRALSIDELRALGTAEERGTLDLLACWDLGLGPDSHRVIDTAGDLHGRVVNMPTRAVTGHNWSGEEGDFRRRPEEYGAIHFHEDDLEDAGWERDFTLTVPEDLPSGVYAARLRADGVPEDHVPFVLRPRTGVPTAEVAFLVPTLTYLAYANERLLARSAEIFGEAAGEELLAEAENLKEPADRYLDAHPEVGASLYDTHLDGSGVCYSSRLRPIPNIRPRYRFWDTGAPERFPSDLYVTDWLEEKGFAFDAFADEDVHEDGLELLKPYKAIVTGCHPEYWTGTMLDALEAYLDQGGRMLYLGGNGFYWVTSIDPQRPHMVEVRRGISGTRAWESQPGELHLSTTGEPGGLWRFRGRTPNRLVGTGFTSQSDSREPAAPYARTPGSYDPAVSWIFDGVGEDELIGDFGLINGGAAGYEIDRFDHERGTPWRTHLLATSAGRHNDS
ncbi:MAG: hypothetical protein QOE36_2521, partial [Gaiellaceae bacterium]|nr:hypothetical protein [Gaiellaceae bacterium]